MIDMQKLLVGMATQGASGNLKPQRRVGGRAETPKLGLPQGKIVMGLLGLAVSAYEHYADGAAAGRAANAQPLTQKLPSPSLPQSTEQAPPIDSEQLLLLRAMVAAAHADGVLDPSERSTIVELLERGTLSADERTFIAQELSNPCPIEALIAQAGSDDVRARVFAAAALAIIIDTDAERRFMEKLGTGLGLSEEQKAAILGELDAVKVGAAA